MGKWPHKVESCRESVHKWWLHLTLCGIHHILTDPHSDPRDQDRRDSPRGLKVPTHQAP